MPTSSSVSSSAQSSTTTTTLASLSLKGRGRRRSARSTSASNFRRFTAGPAPAGSEPAHALDVDDVGDLADGAHDALEMGEVRHLHHEVVGAAAVVGDGHLGLRDVAVPRGDGPGDLGEEPRAVVADVDGDADRALRRLLDVPLDVDDALAVQHALGHGEAVACVDGEAAAPRDEADDVVAG